MFGAQPAQQGYTAVPLTGNANWFNSWPSTGLQPSNNFNPAQLGIAPSTAQQSLPPGSLPNWLSQAYPQLGQFMNLFGQQAFPQTTFPGGPAANIGNAGLFGSIYRR